MCARTVDESFDYGDHTSSCSDIRQTGNDVMSSRVTSSGEFPVTLRSRRRGMPLAWRYSLPATIASSTTANTAVRRPTNNAVPTSVSISGDDNEPRSGVGRCRPLCKYIATGNRNVTESGPRVRPTCLRYSYWLTLDERRYVSKYSTPTAADKFSGYEDQLRRHFRPRSCEIINVSREPALRRIASSRNGELVTNDDNESVLRHRTCRHVTGRSASGPLISTSTSALDVKTDCGAPTTPGAINRASSRTVRLNPDNDHDGRSGDGRVNSVSDVSVDRSRDEAEVDRRLSLSKIGDSGLGTSIHSEQTSPDDTAAALAYHHQQQQQQQLSDKTLDANECQCQTDCEGHVQGHIEDNDDDDRTKLTRHKRE